MINADISPGILSVNAELNAGIEAIADARFGQAHAILLALFLAPEIPLWFRKMFCAEPLRQLARAYLPTRAALRRMRDHTVDRLINGEHSAVLLGRALLLDKALDDRDATPALLRRLDVFAGDLLVRCRDTVILAFAEHGDMPRARKYWATTAPRPHRWQSCRACHTPPGAIGPRRECSPMRACTCTA